MTDFKDYFQITYPTEGAVAHGSRVTTSIFANRTAINNTPDLGFSSICHSLFDLWGNTKHNNEQIAAKSSLVTVNTIVERDALVASLTVNTLVHVLNTGEGVWKQYLLTSKDPIIWEVNNSGPSVPALPAPQSAATSTVPAVYSASSEAGFPDVNDGRMSDGFTYGAAAYTIWSANQGAPDDDDWGWIQADFSGVVTLTGFQLDHHIYPHNYQTDPDGSVAAVYYSIKENPTPPPNDGNPPGSDWIFLYDIPMGDPSIDPTIDASQVFPSPIQVRHMLLATHSNGDGRTGGTNVGEWWFFQDTSYASGQGVRTKTDGTFELGVPVHVHDDYYNRYTDYAVSNRDYPGGYSTHVYPNTVPPIIPASNSIHRDNITGPPMLGMITGAIPVAGMSMMGHHKMFSHYVSGMTPPVVDAPPVDIFKIETGVTPRAKSFVIDLYITYMHEALSYYNLHTHPRTSHRTVRATIVVLGQYWMDGGGANVSKARVHIINHENSLATTPTGFPNSLPEVFLSGHGVYLPLTSTTSFDFSALGSNGFWVETDITGILEFPREDSNINIWAAAVKASVYHIDPVGLPSGNPTPNGNPFENMYTGYNNIYVSNKLFEFL